MNSRLDQAWWAPALALHERVGGHPTVHDAEAGSDRFASWRARFSDTATFDRRLADAGLDESTLLMLLAEPIDTLAARAARPDWVVTAEAAVAAAPEALPEPGLDELLRPLTAIVIGRLRQLDDSDAIDLDALTTGYADRLTRLLVQLATPTFTAEPHVDRLDDLFSRYPVLARVLTQTAELRTDALIEVLKRFTADRAEIVRTIFGGADPGPVREIAGDVGDVHQRGRSVQILSFADGSRAVYKPRGVAAQVCLVELIEWLNKVYPELELETTPLVSRGDHGWMPFIPGHPASGHHGMAAFYRRLGALLALLHAMRATDMHYQNVIASGDHPVVVDAETLFHPLLAAAPLAADPAAHWLATSVARTGLLPSRELGEDGMGDVSAIRVGGADPGEFTEDFLHGFRDAYNAIARNKAEFLDLIQRYEDVDVRVVMRPTRGYVALLDESLQPECLRDGLDRDQVFDTLWAESAHDPLRWSLARHEVLDLWVGDVPLFYGRPGAADLRTCTGVRLGAMLNDIEQLRAGETISGLGEADRRDQEWVVLATLATRAPQPGHRGMRSRHDLKSVAAQPDRLLAASCAIADQLVVRALDVADRVNWLGLELVEDRQWLVLPMGAGLANGYLGVALLLAQLSKLTGIGRYADIAHRVAGSYGHLHRTLTDHPSLAAAVGCGGLHGLGGVAYGLSRLAVLLDDGEAARVAGETVDLTAPAVEHTDIPDWGNGLAGCLAAMTAIHEDLSLASARALAIRCADRLLDTTTDGTGFVDGSAGIAYALARTTDAGHLRAARAMRPDIGGHDTVGAGPGWCSGISGRLLAQLTISPQERESPQAQTAIHALAARSVSADLSLCHGELGIADTLIHLGLSESIPHRAGLILDSIRRYGPTCGTPDAVPTPGFLSGLAGIGYGLLRLGYPTQVPSALLLEPATELHRSSS